MAYAEQHFLICSKLKSLLHVTKLQYCRCIWYVILQSGECAFHKVVWENFSVVVNKFIIIHVKCLLDCIYQKSLKSVNL